MNERRPSVCDLSGLLDGERKLVTVLFADIVKSSVLISNKDPEDANQILLSILEIMIESVHRFNGTVSQILGDGIMAIFGAPVALEDHAIRACFAADAMQTNIKQVFGVKPRQVGPPVAIRVGLNSGEVMAHTVENDLYAEYRVVGETVHLAALMESFAKPGSIVVTEPTLKLASEQLQTRRIGEVRLSPNSIPVGAFEMAGINLDRIDLDYLFRDTRTPLIGREKYLDSFRHIFNKVRSGSGQVLVITGEAGVGKSRLVFEFLESVKANQFRLVECNSLAAGMGRPLGPLATVIRDLLLIEDQQSGKNIHKTVSSFLKSLNIRNEHAVSAILDVLGFQADEPAWTGIDQPERLHLAVETVTQVISEMSHQHPLVIIFEDFQWADSETRLLADKLAESISSSRVLFIVTSRTHHEKVWAAWPRVIEHEIHPLSRRESAQLLGVLLGSETYLDELKDLLAQRTQGNPLFIEECVPALESTGGLTGVPGSYRLAVPVADLNIPATVHGVLAARIDTLSPADKSTLLCASVIGDRFDIGLLRELVGTPQRALLVQLGRLQQAGFIERTRTVPNLEYSFRHVLIHDVAYGTLLKRRRLGLHANIIDAIEKRPPRQLPGKIELLAHHALRAEKWPRAYVYGRRAGQRALAESRNREAADFLENALEALERLPQTKKYAVRSVDLGLALAQAFFPLGEYDRAHNQLLEARALAEHLHDVSRLAKISSIMIIILWRHGDLRHAVRTAKIATKFARKLKDWRLEALSEGRLGGLMVDRGDYGAACQLLKTTIAHIPDDETHRAIGSLGVASVGWRATLALSLGELGRFSEAIQVGDEALGIVDEVRHEFAQAHANLYIGHVLIRKGDFERSVPLLERSFSLCKKSRIKLLFPLSAATLGYAYARMGNVGEGISLIEEATCNAKRQALMFRLPLEMAWLAETYLMAGRLEDAVKSASIALELARQQGEVGHEAWALWVLGDIHLSFERKSDNKADRYFRKAQELAVSRCMAPLIAHCHFGLGKLHCSQMSRDAAQSELGAAARRYRKLDMGYWLSLAKAELGAMKKTETLHTG